MRERTALIMISIAALLAFISLVNDTLAARRLGGEVCQCQYANTCRYVNLGFGEFVGYNYHLCGGACSAYGMGWVQDARCVYPEKTPRYRR